MKVWLSSPGTGPDRMRVRFVPDPRRSKKYVVYSKGERWPLSWWSKRFLGSSWHSRLLGTPSWWQRLRASWSQRSMFGLFSPPKRATWCALRERLPFVYSPKTRIKTRRRPVESAVAPS